MGSWTSFLNLFKPAKTDSYNVITQQDDNWDKIDAGVSALNSKIKDGSDGAINLNNYTTTGMYAFNGGTSTNAPASGASTLIVQRYSNDWISQMVTIITANGSEVYVRDYHDGTTWSSWEKLALNSKIENITTLTLTIDNNVNLTIVNQRCGKKIGLYVLQARIKATDTISTGEQKIGTISERPPFDMLGNIIKISNSKYVGAVTVYNDGNVYINLTEQLPENTTVIIQAFTM